MALVALTTKMSIIAQTLSFFPSIRGVLHPVTQSTLLLREILKIELAVTLVQLTFYITLLRQMDVDKMATTRYYDWFITTPTMLFSMAAYFTYVKEPTTTIPAILRNHKKPLMRMFVANFIMLLTGYMAEIGLMDRRTSLVIGFAAFAVVFWTLRKEFVSEESKGVFNMLTTVWGLYGVAFMLPTAEKNIMYNGLDIISKNLFAIFLSYKLSGAN